MSTKEGVRFLTRFIFLVSDQSDQPGPPSLEKGRHEQALAASTSFSFKYGSNTLVGDVSLMNSGGVNPIRGGGWDGAIMSSDECCPHAICHFPHKNFIRLDTLVVGIQSILDSANF